MDILKKFPWLTDYTEQERKQFIKEVYPGIEACDLVSFDGENCDECSGWNGESRRCMCGNRRVTWVYDYGMWYAEAW